jgi:hypothetical protein
MKVKPRKRGVLQSTLRTDAPAFQPSFTPTASPVKKKILEIRDPVDMKVILPLPTPPPTAPPSTLSTSPLTEEKKVPDTKSPLPSVEIKETSEDAFLRRMEAIKLAAKPMILEQSKNLVVDDVPVAISNSTSSLSRSIVVAETSKVSIETPSTPAITPEKKPTTSTLTTTTITATVTTTKSISKSKAIPQVPPFKSKITTHTRTEQESLAPILPLRGGSSTSTTVITDMISSPKSGVSSIPKGSLPVVSNLEVETRDDSTQSLDTGAKAPHKVAWFIVLWTFVCSWCSDLAHDVKDLFAFLWASIILRLPFFTSNATKGTKPKATATTRPPMKKPTAAKHYKGRPLKETHNEGKMRK